MTINWFPGHMKKAMDEIKEKSQQVDLYCEVLDARIARSSINQNIREITQDKPRLILLNKSDLANPKITEQWLDYLKQDQQMALPFNALTDRKGDTIYRAARQLLEDEFKRREQRGISNQEIRMLIYGIPNSGKSSVINNLAQRRSAKVGDRPGLTRHQQWIKSSHNLLLLDTPGIMPPKLDERQSYHLAYTGAIRDEVLPIEDVGYHFIKGMGQLFPQALSERYGIEVEDDPLVNMDAVARSIGAIVKGGEVDYTRVANRLLDDYRKNRFGPMSLESPKE